MPKSSQPQLPAWLWLFTGIVTGLFAAFLVYLAGLRPPQSAPAAAQRATPPPRSAPAAPAKATVPQNVTESPRKFDFYTLLPEAEALGAPTEATAPSQNAAAKPSAPTARLFLQTGSFPRAQDADKLRAQLLLLGLPVSVQKVELKPGEVWHRVQAGPFADTPSLAQAQKTLAAAGVQSIVIRPKGT